MRSNLITKNGRLNWIKNPKERKVSFSMSSHENGKTQLVMLTTFPPRECGIATYSQDLIHALNNKFSNSFDIKICALENSKHSYSKEVCFVLETRKSDSYIQFTEQINASKKLNLVVIQHEFGLFRGNENDLLQMIMNIQKELVIVFHTVLPKPNKEIQHYIYNISKSVSAIIVMTESAKKILIEEYLVSNSKIKVIPHGTHLVSHIDKEILKQKYNFNGKKILSTFGLLSSGKSIETTINAMPSIIKFNPNILFLIIGKTHPSIVEQEGEKYRMYLEALIKDLDVNENVRFINEYLSLDSLLDYLQFTDIYLFTSKDPNQSVSGTFSYAISSGCPIISTPIPHALEVLQKGSGRIIDFGDSQLLAQEVITLLKDESLRNSIRLNGLHQMAPTAWENSALIHADLFKTITHTKRSLQFKIPPINLDHLQKMTTKFGIIQFSVLNQPDLMSGYTLDDNARALIAMCQHYSIKRDKKDLVAIECYLDFIIYCFQANGYFANYVSKNQKFTKQNKKCNLEDSYGRAIWALGYLISLHKLFPKSLIEKAELLFNKALIQMEDMYSTRAMAFSIKGIFYANLKINSKQYASIIEKFADRLVQMYKHEADRNWQWYESYLTYANSVLPEALLFAWIAIRKTIYQSIALLTFDFLLSKMFTNNYIQVISNNGWLHNGQAIDHIPKGGEQPIDVAYTIMALSEFYAVFKIEDYHYKMITAFNWFLGQNHLNQIIYNPCTGGCYDGLESNYVNLNQGAESTISYLMARLTIERNTIINENTIKPLDRIIYSEKIHQY